jgi:hypothetical protein
VRGTGYGVRGMWYEIRGTWYRVHGTGHSRAQMNNKDNIFVLMAYSRLDWNPPARGVAGGGCKISPVMIFTTNNHKKQNEDLLYTYMHAIHTQVGLELPRKVGCRGALYTCTTSVPHSDI